jgi:hypothetical protein
MKEIDFINLSVQVLDEIQEQVGDIRGNFISNADQAYIRRMFLAYHNELIKRGYLVE